LKNGGRINVDKIRNFSEYVMSRIICSSEFEEHQVNGAIRSNKENNLHACVINRYEIGEQVKISSCKDQGKQHL